MKKLVTLGLIFGAGSALGQTVHPAGAATTTVNWDAVAATSGNSTASLPLDLDGDLVNDVTFLSDNYLNAGTGMRYTFSVAAPVGGAQVALDSSQYDSAHRFQAGEAIRWGLRWDSSGGYLDYTLIGNGGVGGRGFFRDGQPGYVVVRKQLAANQWRYWWIRVRSTTNGTCKVQVDFYGTSLGAALARSAPAAKATLLAYPNPSTDGWLLPAGSQGTYRVLNSQGQVVTQGQLGASQPRIAGQALAPGLYWLEQEENGRLTRQVLSKR